MQSCHHRPLSFSASGQPHAYRPTSSRSAPSALRYRARAIAVSAAGRPNATSSGEGQLQQQLREEVEQEEEETGGGNDIEIPAKATHVTVVDGFLAGTAAEDLRGVFDAHHAEPRRVHEYRFVWDYWHVPGQYTLLRTPAADYFPKEQYDDLEAALLTYARRELGCAGVTPVWLSCYVDGCRQELHADVPHGPWAFVLSLTRWEARRFTGGETFVMRPEVLDYWRGFDADAVVERGSLVQQVEPLFNRMTVFDPRLPHGVSIVEGTRDPREGRLVLHGWFNEPAPFFSGALTEEAAEPTLAAALPPLYAALAELPRARGMLTLRLSVNPRGAVEKVAWLADSLVPSPGDELPSPTEIRDAIMLEIAGTMMDTAFPAAEGPSEITMPFMFD
mmetsp:Transcript_33912/g.85372  ORF Transcript_33912/g.85372 Transcript_33912/m.85372 type:complete len:390 (-) Transcript_33912:69-1238(-)